MAALQPVAQTCRVVVEGKWVGQNCVNVFHVTKIAPIVAITQVEVDNLAAITRSAYVAQFAPLMDADYVIGNCIATDLSSDVAPVGSASGIDNGTKVGTSNPASVALCCTWEIQRRYRGGHPRTYFPGTVNGDYTGVKDWSSVIISQWGTACDAFRQQLNQFQGSGDSQWSMTAVHRKRNKVDLIPPLISPITGSHIDPRVDSQRRRLGKGAQG